MRQRKGLAGAVGLAVVAGTWLGAASAAWAQFPAGTPARRPSPMPTPFVATGATSPLIEAAERVEIDWTNLRVVVRGHGLPTDNGPRAFRRQLAERDARADAYRRLKEALLGLRVDGNVRLRDLAVGDEALRSRVEAFVKASRVVELVPGPSGEVELVLSAELRGERGLGSMLGVSSRPLADAAASEAAASAPAATDFRSQHSSAIVDARGQGAAPALGPTLRDEANKAIELPGLPGRVRYLRGGAELDPAAGVNPLKLKVLRTQGNGRADLVLDGPSAEALKAALLGGKLPANAPILVML